MRTTPILDPPVGDVPASPGSGGVTWRRVLTIAALGQLAMAGYLLAITVVLDGRFDPTPVVVGAVVGLGVWRLGRGGRGGRGAVAYAGVVSVLLLLLVAAFGGLGGLLRPQSTFEFVLFGGLVIASVLGIVAVPGAWRGGSTSASIVRIAGAAVVLVVVVGVVAGAMSGSATRMAGDLTMRAKNYEFDHTVLEARAGRVAVFVANDDVSSHDFSIKGVVHKELPGQKAGRAVFDVAPGVYRFYCSLHPDMEGRLRVS